MAERKPDEAIPLYEKALEIRKGVEHSERDADFASENATLDDHSHGHGDSDDSGERGSISVPSPPRAGFILRK